jgi:uncharacterized protein YjiS (DUF1127 family)
MREEIFSGCTVILPTARMPVAVWLRRIRTRSSLRHLDARQLEDIGCSEQQRQCECAKWFWQK